MSKSTVCQADPLSSFVDAHLPGFERLGPGVFRIVLGSPETITPVQRRPAPPAWDRFSALPEAERTPFLADEVSFRIHARGCTVVLPYSPDEGVFGLGLQLKSHLQAGKKKKLRVNADPLADTGDSHAPVPFFASTAGYGILVDTARYVSFYVGTHARPSGIASRVKEKWDSPARSTEELYRSQAIGDCVVIDIPAARGVALYLFAGPAMGDAIARYNLFSGGGVLPPRWALGNWYRTSSSHDAADVERMIGCFEADGMPFSVLGLEPGWQSCFYPNSFVWNPQRFPDPRAFLGRLSARDLRVNLWENAFVHPECPFFEAIRPHCADELATDGLVPDFLDPKACAIFSEHHARLVDQGVAGFKLDECDNGDFVPHAWSFPEFARFPSGADGEQMHSLYGIHYQNTLHQVFRDRDRRHFDLVRSSGALAASLPYVLYSDLYEHRDFLRGTVNAAYSGLLWTPEVRDAASTEDLVRRVQSAALSPISLINGWYCELPPWRQTNTKLNQEKIEMQERDEATALVRQALLLRVQLVPYLYTAFFDYYSTGRPPFRGLAFDFPGRKSVWSEDRTLLIGRDLLFHPLVAGEREVEFFLPPGIWRDFTTGVPSLGDRRLRVTDIPVGRILLYVRDGALLPLANPDVPNEIIPHVFADDSASGSLYEDDGCSYAFERGDYTIFNLCWHRADGLSVIQTAGRKTGLATHLGQVVTRCEGTR